MKNAIILHGSPSKPHYYNTSKLSPSNSDWFPWLQSQLLKKDIAAATPEVPHPYDPQWDLWRSEVERYEVTENTVLVGHSCGAGFFVRWLSENKNITCAKLILVGPWMDPHKTDAVEFFDFEIDPDISKRVNEIIIFGSDDDMDSVKESIKILREQIKNIKYHEFQGYGHFTEENMRSAKFPELLEEVLR